ncbi:HAD hydrolase-like protein [Candidatus Woesearchaeota archaeon]|nr:HAD hydrolase-like protein [Candidatus Woesearchaeota archaeon]
MGAILFDLDNTLVDNREYFPYVAHTCLKELGIHTTIDDVVERNLDHFEDFIRSYNLDTADFFKVWIKHDSDRARAVREGRIKLFPDTIPILQILGAFYRLGIFTNTPQEKAFAEINGLGLDVFFRKGSVSCYDFVLPNKPSPELALRALEGIGHNRQEMLWVVGDTKNDVESGNNLRQLGFNTKTIYINLHNKPYEADFVVSSLKEAYQKIQNGLQKRG